METDHFYMQRLHRVAASVCQRIARSNLPLKCGDQLQRYYQVGLQNIILWTSLW